MSTSPWSAGRCTGCCATPDRRPSPRQVDERAAGGLLPPAEPAGPRRLRLLRRLERGAGGDLSGAGRPGGGGRRDPLAGRGQARRRRPVAAGGRLCEIADRAVDPRGTPEDDALLREGRRVVLARCRTLLDPNLGQEDRRRSLRILRRALLDGWSSEEIVRAEGGRLAASTIHSLVHRVRRRLVAPLAARQGSPAGRDIIPTHDPHLHRPRLSRPSRSRPAIPSGRSGCPGVVDHLRGSAAGRSPETPAAGGPDAEAREAVTAVHDEAYVARFERAAARGDSLLDSADNPLSAGTWAAAWAAVGGHSRGGGLGGRRGATARPSRRCARRATTPSAPPPWASASSTTPRWPPSTCAAGTAPRGWPIFDFDVHHGNGTQHLFEERADVFYASTHQYPFYPGTGAASERGIGAGRGVHPQRAAPRRHRRRGVRRGDPRADPAGAAPLRPRRPDPLRRLRRLAARSAGRHAGDRGGVPPLGRAGAPSSPPRSAAAACSPCSKGGYDLASLPRLVEAHLEGLAGGRISPYRRKPMIDFPAAIPVKSAKVHVILEG